MAEDLDQANIVFAVARAMVENTPALERRAKCYRRLIEHENGGIYRVIPGDAAGAHGLNIHGCIFDELHTQANRELWDVLTSAQGARTQPLTWAFTTAGTDRASVCYEQHDYGEKVARNINPDPAFKYIRYGLEEGDDWQSEDVWRKCNPALGDFLSMNFLKSEYAKAKASPARQNTFRNLYLNEWTNQVERWLDMDVWDASAGMGATEADLAGGVCYGGLYLGPVGKVAAWVLAFPDPDDIERVRVLPRFFCPRAEVQNGRDAATYQDWERRGLLTVTDGDAADYPAIREQIIEDAGKFDLREMNLRNIFKGAQLATELVDIFGEEQVHWFRPTPEGYAASTREVERLLRAGKLNHGGHPVLRWMADNVAVKSNEKGDVRPDADASQGSIAGIIGLCMAIDLAIQHVDYGEPHVAVFEY